MKEDKQRASVSINDKPLYKPFKSKRKDKKFSVYVKGDKGQPKLIHFGQVGYQDFTQHKDPKRREAYRKRARGIKNKKGQRVYLLKDTPAWWSYNYLW